ncbi:VC0807 family protein [Streptomyces puniciscabiei]|uniref:VC0807 family protein n=1 Tax=Streptomyces puniciscabiei TaxID=164348 RepID=UPI003331990C
MADVAGMADGAGMADAREPDGADVSGQERRWRTGAGTGGIAHGPLLTVAVDILLPLLVYYAARGLAVGQGAALLLSGAPPALRLVSGAVRQRRIDGVDLFCTVLLAAAALATLIGGGTRLLLFKDAALSLVVGGWILGTAFTSRPLAFQLGQRLHRGPAAGARAGTWRDSADFRRALRVLTVVWGTGQLLDGGLGTLAAATLPTDVVPLLARVLSLLLLALTGAATVACARRFRTRHGLPLFGAPGTAAGTGDRPEVHRPTTKEHIRTPAAQESPAPSASAAPARRPGRAGACAPGR